MTDTNQVGRFAEAVISMIKEDQSTGQIPADVASLDELDNYIDVYDYYLRVGLPGADHDAAELRAAVDAEIGRRLASAQGGPWHVIWRQPDGATQDIGRSVGYRRQAEAQAVGRKHVHAHGGRFQLRKA